MKRKLVIGLNSNRPRPYIIILFVSFSPSVWNIIHVVNDGNDRILLGALDLYTITIKVIEIYRRGIK